MADDSKMAPRDFGMNPQGAKLSLRAWLRIFSASNLIEREIRSRLQSHFGVSLARYDFLAQLHREPEHGMTMGELGDCLMVTGGSITGLTDRLEADQLVRRVANPNDRRSHVIELTYKGKAAFAEMAKAHDGWLEELFSGLAPNALPTLIQQIDEVKAKVRQAIDKHPTKEQKDS